MGSFDRPFRGLPAEIRLMIWKYVALPTINITEVVRDNLKRHTGARTGEPPNEDRPHPCATQNQLSLDQSVFKSPLQFLAAVTTINRVVRAEFIPVIQKHGLSFQVDLPATSLIHFLAQHFHGPHAPKIRAVEMCAPYRRRLQSRLESLANAGPGRPRQQPPANTETLRSRPLVDQVEINIDSRGWSADAEWLARIRGITLSMLEQTDPSDHRCIIELAAYDIEHGFDTAEKLIAKKLARRVVFNINNIHKDYKDSIFDDHHEKWGRDRVSEHCVVMLGPLIPEDIETHDLIEVGTYYCQIVVTSKSEV